MDVMKAVKAWRGLAGLPPEKPSDENNGQRPAA